MTTLITPPAPLKPTAPAPAAAPSPTFPSAPGWPPLYRFTVEQYHAMIEAGIVPEDNQHEFILGLVVRKMSKNPAHCFAQERLGERLPLLVAPLWRVRSQDPIALADGEPEPDQSVYPASVNTGLRHPRGDEVALVVEVADSTLNTDRNAKKVQYASALIPVYWIVNIPDRQVEVYTGPSGPGASPDYATRADHGLGDSVPVAIMGAEVGRIPVADLFPQPGGTP
ncbi:MAG: Uma2 family endonuclease [Gemmataceae bacterium]|nr:Uma2 family endonuclease [Gemmataceae bacterium]